MESVQRAGGAGSRVGGAAEEAAVWEVTVKGRAFGAGTKGGGPRSTIFTAVNCCIDR